MRLPTGRPSTGNRSAARHPRQQLKRFSPAALLAMAAAFVILLDAAVVVVPQAMADPNSSATATAPAQQVVARGFVSLASPTVEPSASPSTAVASPSFLPFFASTVVLPAPTASPSPPAPAKPAAKKPAPKYRDTVANARIYVKNRIGVRQYNCINIIWYHESRWSWRAENPNSGAYGIPQALPGNKMAAFGSNWRTSPLTQVKWGIWYVNNRYGSACGAYAFWSAHHWY